MKKHFMRVLVVLLAACVGVGILAACGEDEPAPPAPTTYTVEFSLGEHAAAGTETPAKQTGKAVGDTVTLSALQAAQGWAFEGWYTKNGKVEGTTYTVKAADAEEGTVTLTAHYAADMSTITGYDGVWTLEEGGAKTEVSLKLAADKATAQAIIYTVVPAASAGELGDEHTIRYYTLDWTENGYYVKDRGTSYTFLTDGGALNMTKTAPNPSGFGGDVTTTTTFAATARTDLPAAAPAEPTGLRKADFQAYGSGEELVTVTTLVDFERHTVTAEMNDYDFTVTSFANYLLLNATLDEEVEEDEEPTTATFFVYKEADKYYILGGGEYMEPSELQDAGELQTYIVSFKLGAHAAAGAEAPQAITAVEYSNIVLPDGPAAAEGYKFYYWEEITPSTSDDNPTYREGKKFKVTGDVQLTGVYGDNIYHLSFDKNAPAGVDASNIHGTLQSRIDFAKVGDTKVLPVLQLDGYIFKGWKWGAEGSAVTSFTLTNEVIAALEGAVEIHLSAVWEKVPANRFAITFERGDLDETVVDTLTGMPANTTAAAGSFSIPAEEPACDGYIFKGWKVADDDTVYKKGGDHATYTVTDKAVAFVAQWEKVKYTVTYDYGVGTDQTKDSEQYGWGEEVYFPAEPTAKPGYKFSKWVAKKVSGGNALEGRYLTTFTMPTEDVVVTATWTKVYTVHFELGDHAATDASVADVADKAAGSSVTLPTPQGAEGWEFDGWYKKGGTKVEKDKSGKINYVVVAADADGNTITLTAHWKENTTQYTVTFSFGDESHAKAGTQPPTSETKKVNGTVTLTDPEAEDGWEFDGWYTKSGKIDGDTYTVSVADADDVTITITAHWKKGVTLADYVGTWTHENNIVTIALGETGGLYAVVKDAYTDFRGKEHATYTFYTLTAAAEGEGFEDTDGNKFVIVNGSLEVTIAEEIIYTKGTADEPISPTGTYTSEWDTWTVDFDKKTWDIGTGATQFDNPIAVGGYLVITVTRRVSSMDVSITYIVYKIGNDFYACQSGSEDSAEKLTLSE